MRLKLTFAILLFACSGLFAQKKPTLMILPSDNWCSMRYFMTRYDSQGQTIETPDYQQAFRQDTELPLVISKIGQLLTAKGYSLKDAEMQLKNIAQRTAEDNMTQSRSTGAALAESPLDVLKRRAKADIIIQIGWSVDATGSENPITFTIEAFDSYTSKRIATSTGTMRGTADNIARNLQDAVSKNLKPFCKQMDDWYGDMERNGREIVLNIRTWEDWDGSLDDEFGGKELLSAIQSWLKVNTIKGQFNLSDATDDMAQFEQVRIPLETADGTALDARAFARKLQVYLKGAPFNIQSKLMMRGLGEATLVLGEK